MLLIYLYIYTYIYIYMVYFIEMEWDISSQLGILDRSRIPSFHKAIWALDFPHFNSTGEQLRGTICKDDGLLPAIDPIEPVS